MIKQRVVTIRLPRVRESSTQYLMSNGKTEFIACYIWKENLMIQAKSCAQCWSFLLGVGAHGIQASWVDVCISYLGETALIDIQIHFYFTGFQKNGTVTFGGLHKACTLKNVITSLVDKLEPTSEDCCYHSLRRICSWEDGILSLVHPLFLVSA